MGLLSGTPESLLFLAGTFATKAKVGAAVPVAVTNLALVSVLTTGAVQMHPLLLQKLAALAKAGSLYKSLYFASKQICLH